MNSNTSRGWITICFIGSWNDAYVSCCVCPSWMDEWVKGKRAVVRRVVNQMYSKPVFLSIVKSSQHIFALASVVGSPSLWTKMSLCFCLSAGDCFVLFHSLESVTIDLIVLWFPRWEMLKMFHFVLTRKGLERGVTFNSKLNWSWDRHSGHFHFHPFFLSICPLEKKMASKWQIWLPVDRARNHLNWELANKKRLKLPSTFELMFKARSTLV